ncbi:choline/carnitine/betaine transporter [Pseudarthrobacter chlorophenolicus A6]|uniref:Choline/carnitine/betaine transporter n=2 Tax=Pseudarthrobacter chlorophenolicus TaxID=85085 RepID=B8HGN4_PSECP|nr:choline/carnitine/betaine transporter [Pseudarthrobacter chlorophenolicus A6]SDQ66655.1 choline/glycine/proline betaine transport protein [Pseudarthrobacter chlorophenolicus]
MSVRNSSLNVAEGAKGEIGDMSATPGTRTISKPPGQPPEAVNEPDGKGAGRPPGAANHRVTPWVFWPAAGIIFLFVLFATIFPAAATDLFGSIQGNVIKWFGWYYVAAIAVFVAFALWIGLSRYGDIKLGKDEDEPEFSVMSWFALLFAAGMGIGLVFFGVAEPLNHFAAPRPGLEGSPLVLAQQAMTQTYLHWGLHAWAIYVVVGVSIAYAVHRRNRPISIRWTLEPLLGRRRVAGAWGNLIDVVALVGTLFGVATSLGLGVLQISSGLEQANIVQATTMTQIGLILCIITLTIVSVVSGVGKGMKWLSNTNLILAGLLMLVVLFTGPTLFLLREFVQSIGHYLQNVVGLTFNTLAFSGAEGEAWQAAWTTFYWGWWISWAPFVGIFIARISKGRTVRQFVAGVLLVPTTVGFLWFSVLGGAAIHRELFGSGGLISDDGTVDTEGALFNLLGSLPGGTILTVGAILLIAIFFITSADSGALVMGMISTGGDVEPKNWLRIFWALASAAVAIALLLANGLQAIQTAAILTAVPFSVVIILMCISTAKAFHLEHATLMRAQRKLGRDQMTAHVTEHVTEHVQETMADSVQEHYQEHLADQVQDQISEAVEAQLSERAATEASATDAPAGEPAAGRRKP